MDVTLNFDDRDEVLTIVESGGEMMDYFLSSKVLKRCPFIEHNVKVRSEKIGAGSYGKVYSVLSPDASRVYAVKKTKNRIFKIIEHVWHDQMMKLSDIAALLTFSEDLDVDWKLFYALNGNNQDRYVRKGEYYYSAIYRKKKIGCKVKKPIQVRQFQIENHAPGEYDHLPFKSRPREKKVYTGKVFDVPPGSYVCENDTYIEYVIGVLCASLVSKLKCANFLDVFGFSMCSQPSHIITPKLFDYTFMERIDYPVIDLYRKGKVTATESIVDSIYIQTLFAICAMQRVLGVQHNDLHLGNVFLIDLKKTDWPVLYNSRDLRYVEYFEYEIDGTKIYIKNEGLLVKIGDFGFAAKYSTPIISSNSVPFPVPNFRDDYYDFTYFTAMMFIIYGRKSKLISNIVSSFFVPTSTPETTISKAYDRANELFNKHGSAYFLPNRRPLLKPLTHLPSFYLKAYTSKFKLPKGVPSVRVVNLGKLEESDNYPNYTEVESVKDVESVTSSSHGLIDD
jgi:serine/threonine protein kinase